LKQPLTPPQRNVLATYCTWNHRLAIEIGQWSAIPISKYNRLYLFCSHNIIIETNAHFVSEYPLYNSTRGKFQSLSEIVVFENLKSFFQLDLQAYIGLYVTEPPQSTTLRNYPVWNEPNVLLISPITSLLASRTLKSISFHSIPERCNMNPSAIMLDNINPQLLRRYAAPL